MEPNHHDRAWIAGPEAAARASVTTRAIYLWCRRYRLGNKIAGRWRIDPEALARMLAGDRPVERPEAAARPAP